MKGILTKIKNFFITLDYYMLFFFTYLISSDLLGRALGLGGYLKMWSSRFEGDEVVISFDPLQTILLFCLFIALDLALRPYKERVNKRLNKNG